MGVEGRVDVEWTGEVDYRRGGGGGMWGDFSGLAMAILPVLTSS